MDIQFTVLKEKFVGRTVQDGYLTELSDFETRLSSSHVLAVLSNLEIMVAPTSHGHGLTPTEIGRLSAVR
jgi:hypothetical protein